MLARSTNSQASANSGRSRPANASYSAHSRLVISLTAVRRLGRLHRSGRRTEPRRFPIRRGLMPTLFPADLHLNHSACQKRSHSP